MYTDAARELTESWRLLASQAGLPFEVVTGAVDRSPIAAPARHESGWEMIYPEGTRYRVHASAVLRIQLPGTAPRTEEELLLWAGPVSAMALWSCGHFPLHAVGLHLADSAVAVFAPPGGGKSTLAAVALDNGLPVQGDDLLGISREGTILPRAGSLRISPAHAPAGLAPVCTLRDGRGWYPLPRPAPARLGSLLLLRRGPVPALTPVQGHRRLALLLSAGFLSRYDPVIPPGWQDLLLSFCANLPVAELQVPDGVDHLRAAWPRIHELLVQSQRKDPMQ